MEFWSELWLRVEESRECVATDVSVEDGRMRGEDSLVVDITGDSSFMMKSFVHTSGGLLLALGGFSGLGSMGFFRHKGTPE
jgi:hypothetical protein